MKVHLVDGTYELFRYFYSPVAAHVNGDGRGGRRDPGCAALAARPAGATA